MTQLEQIQSAISTLPKQDFVKLREWIEARDWEDWDRQIAEDSASGKLDFLKREAMEARAAGKLRALSVHRTTPQFWNRFDALPKPVQQLAKKNFALLKQNQAHHSLQFKKVGEYWSA